MVAPGASWMPIGELSRRLGVSSDLLRKWERRYGILKPGRTHGNRRLYSRVDEARARVMVNHVRSGVAPAQAAELAIAARFRVTPDAAADAAAPRVAEARERMLAALIAYDETTAEQVLEKLLATAGATVVIRDVFVPFLRELGDRWADRTLSVAQEHFASAFVHSRLLGLARGWDRGLGPKALLACPSQEQHTLGLIAFGVALHQIGWRITYLGADTPLPMIDEAAAAVRPRLVVLAATMPGRLEGAEVRSLAARWPVALAGAGAGPELADRSGASHLAGDPVSAAHSALA
jgi:MerR family transcriptional regulator, light-induced transcriptional regulator